MHISSSFRRVFNFICCNLERMLLANEAQNYLREFFLYLWTEYVFHQNSKFNCVSKTNQTSNPNFPTQVLEKGQSRRQKDVNHVLPLKSYQKRTWLVNLYTLWNRVLYSEHLNFFILLNTFRNQQFLSSREMYTFGVLPEKSDVRWRRRTTIYRYLKKYPGNISFRK